MKILVCISKSPDTTSKIGFTDNNTKFDEAGIQYIINPYDEWYALVKGIELKEANETEYWLELLYQSKYMGYEDFKDLRNLAGELNRLLISIIKTTKKNISVK